MKRDLLESATVFREALVACPKDGFSKWQRERLQNFPKQACELASLLLAHYLRDQGFTSIQSVFGYLNDERDKDKSHVWLEVDGFIVDITPNQFPGIVDPIIVSESAAQSWHSCFHVERREPACAPLAVRAEYKKAYSEIRRWLESGPTLTTS